MSAEGQVERGRADHGLALLAHALRLDPEIQTAVPASPRADVVSMVLNPNGRRLVTATKEGIAQV